MKDSDAIIHAARDRNTRLLDRHRGAVIELEPKYLLQMAHLTTPATVWKYVESAVTKSAANLVMLDLEDSIPRDNPELLDQGRDSNWIPRIPTSRSSSRPRAQSLTG